jgi:hypothetical protein
MQEAKSRPKARKALISFGATGYVYKVNLQIALKTPRKSACERFVLKLRIYEIFEATKSVSPYVSHSIFRVSDGNFMVFYEDCSLDQRLREYQLRSQPGFREMLISITQAEPLQLVKRWAMELSSAAAFFGTLFVKLSR